MHTGTRGLAWLRRFLDRSHGSLGVRRARLLHSAEGPRQLGRVVFDSIVDHLPGCARQQLALGVHALDCGIAIGIAGELLVAKQMSQLAIEEVDLLVERFLLVLILQQSGHEGLQRP